MEARARETVPSRVTFSWGFLANFLISRPVSVLSRSNGPFRVQGEDKEEGMKLMGPVISGKRRRIKMMGSQGSFLTLTYELFKLTIPYTNVSTERNGFLQSCSRVLRFLGNGQTTWPPKERGKRKIQSI